MPTDILSIVPCSDSMKPQALEYLRKSISQQTVEGVFSFVKKQSQLCCDQPHNIPCPSSRCSSLTVPASASKWCRRWTLHTLRTSHEPSTPLEGFQQYPLNYLMEKTATSCWRRGSEGRVELGVDRHDLALPDHLRSTRRRSSAQAPHRPRRSWLVRPSLMPTSRRICVSA